METLTRNSTVIFRSVQTRALNSTMIHRSVQTLTRNNTGILRSVQTLNNNSTMTHRSVQTLINQCNDTQINADTYMKLWRHTPDDTFKKQYSGLQIRSSMNYNTVTQRTSADTWNSILIHRSVQTDTLMKQYSTLNTQISAEKHVLLPSNSTAIRYTYISV